MVNGEGRGGGHTYDRPQRVGRGGGGGGGQLKPALGFRCKSYVRPVRESGEIVRERGGIAVRSCACI